MTWLDLRRLVEAPSGKCIEGGSRGQTSDVLSKDSGVSRNLEIAKDSFKRS